MRWGLRLGRQLALGLLGLGLMIGAAESSARGAALTPEAYWQKLEATRAQLAQLAEAPPEAARAALDAAADEWTAIREVTLPDGTRLPLDHLALAAQLRRDPPDLARLADQIDSILAAREAWPAPRHQAQDLEALNRLLARPEFQWVEQPPSWLEQLWRDLQAAFWRFVAQLIGEAPVDLDGLGYVFTAAGIIGLLIVLIFIARALRAGFAAEAQAHVDDEAAVMSAQAALQRAQALSRAGDYRTAVRYLYLSALLLLDERGLLRYDRSLTNREYLRRVADKPELARHLREVVEVFDRVWYGYQPLDAAAYARYAEHVAALEKQA